MRAVQVALDVLETAAADDRRKTAHGLTAMCALGGYGLYVGLATWVRFVALAAGIATHTVRGLIVVDGAGRIVDNPDADPMLTGAPLWAGRFFAAALNSDNDQMMALLAMATEDADRLAEVMVALLNLCMVALAGAGVCPPPRETP